MKTPLSTRALFAAMLATATPAAAAITSVVETNVAPDPVAQISPDFGEEALSYNDRTHQHNGVAFDEFSGLLSTTGTNIADLPSYLLGYDYVKFSNNARDNANYSAVVNTDTPSTFYVLIDNRINGPNVTVASSSNSDPVLGGTLQWVIDGGWLRMNTGISPNGQPDYSGIDETGDGFGPGIGVNNFMSIYRFPSVATSVTVRNGIYPGNMITVVAVPTAAPPVPIVNYVATPVSITPGSPAQLSWLISPNATGASIDQGVGSVLPLTDANGAGSVSVTPLVNTTYTLTVNTPTGNDTKLVPVSVRPLAAYTASRQRIDAGESVVLNWRVRPDALVSIDGIGSVNDKTDAKGVGTLTVQPTTTTDYVLRAEAELLTSAATIGVVVRPPGAAFALIDIGATGGRAEPGSANGRTIGGGVDGANGIDLPATTLLADTGALFTLALDTLDQDGIPTGGLDWRDRGDSPGLPLNRLGEDFVKNNLGMIRASLGQLPAGTYNVSSYHLDAANSQSAGIRILVTDANGTAVDTTAVGDASWPDHPANTGAPTITNLTTGLIAQHEARFQVTANGTDDVILFFDSTADGVDREVPLAGLRLSRTGPRPPDLTWALIDLGPSTGQAEPGAANAVVIGAANGANGKDLPATTLLSRTGVSFQIALDNLDPAGIPVGGLDWRDRGDAPDVPLGWFSEDFVKNNFGMIRARLTGLPAGDWAIRSYHQDPTLSQSAIIRVLVTDATRTAEDTLVTADSSFPGGDAGAPQLNGISTGMVESKSAQVTVTSNGTDEIVLYFDSTLAGGDTETPLNGLRITSANTPATIPVTSVVRAINGGTASVAVTFTSRADRTYTVYGSTDPASWGAPLTSSLSATGTSTTYTESGIPLSTPRRFYKIREN